MDNPDYREFFSLSLDYLLVISKSKHNCKHLGHLNSLRLLLFNLLDHRHDVGEGVGVLLVVDQGQAVVDMGNRVNMMGRQGVGGLDSRVVVVVLGDYSWDVVDHLGCGNLGLGNHVNWSWLLGIVWRYR